MKVPRPPLQFGDVLAYSNRGFISYMIRRKSNGWANHVAFVVDEDKILHARMGKGLVIEGLESVDDQPCALLRPASPEFAFDLRHDYMKWLEGELGSKYDKISILGFMVGSYHNFLNDPNAWFCSEIVTESLNKLDYHLFNVLADTGSVSPTDVAVSYRLKLIWHNLPEHLTNLLPLVWQ